MMPPRIRQFALTAHVTSSVGWLGAVLVFLALAVVGLRSGDAQTVRGVYLVMERAAWLVLAPLAFASVLTGIVQSLGTTWGLLRHYWVVFKTGDRGLCHDRAAHLHADN
jgi:DMSO/TMAO reductase YedYZ heme-binding membrane subunit